MTLLVCLLYTLLLTCHKGSVRSIGYRSDMLITHISIDLNNFSYYNTILKRFYYILIVLVDQWVSSVNIESVGKFCIGLEIVHSISIKKSVWVWKGVDLQDVNNIIV